MKSVITILLLVSSCTGPRVIGDGCSPRGIDQALREACERWPETCVVGDNMDFFCVDATSIAATGRCGLSGAKDIEACTVWLGRPPMIRGRAYVVTGVSVADAVRHESQHWHLWDDLETNACASHSAECGWTE